jgi:predicted  nucleic acid-binding Zn-ribbon protein
MSVTSQLRKVFEVDQLISGLQSRLTSADRFHSEQQRQLDEMDAKISSIETESKKSKLQQSSLEKEAAALEAKMATLREAMGSARTNKEYSTFLGELNALKAQKDEKDKSQIELMEKAEAATAQIAEINTKRTERVAMVAKAGEERAKRQSEIASKLAELQSKRDTLAKDLAPSELALLAELIDRLGENAMAKVDEIDRRNHEWACSSCMRALPVQSISMILKGQLTRCSNCTCILFADDDQDVGAKKIKKKEAAEQL